MKGYWVYQLRIIAEYPTFEEANAAYDRLPDIVYLSDREGIKKEDIVPLTEFDINNVEKEVEDGS